MSSFDELPPRCFQGVIPAAIATVSRDGTPNITYLSQLFRLENGRAALSCQFFNKTKQNVFENPYATVELWDPVSFDAYRLELRYLHSETAGPLFDQMAMRIQAIASHTGMKGVFRLISADVYEVLACEKREGFLEPAGELGPPEPLDDQLPRTELRGLQLVTQRTCRAQTLDDLLTTLLESLKDAFGFRHSMVLMPDESGERLFTVASRGYGDEGVGAEIAIGDGLLGTVASRKQLLCISSIEGELRYGRAVRASVQATRTRRELTPEIPLPGLPDAQSQLAIPLVAGERLVGVLAVESRSALEFDEWHEAFLQIVGNQAAVAIENVLLRERSEGDDAPESHAVPIPEDDAPPSRIPRRFRFFRNDDCVFVDDEYLIRNVPGRILWKLLREHLETGRTEFSNRELRLDAALGLPAIRDNLESRLVLLRKRLEQKCPELRLFSTARGHFHFEARCPLRLEEAGG
ncbi:MAG TPA: GAF domain-containing protein [Polyangiaceae bacterium]|nr:GAF domain-containing protein [Polyangiaceae bacterium]